MIFDLSKGGWVERRGGGYKGLNMWSGEGDYRYNAQKKISKYAPTYNNGKGAQKKYFS